MCSHFKSTAIPVSTMKVLNASLIKCTLFYISSVPLVCHWLREWCLSSMPGPAARIFLSSLVTEGCISKAVCFWNNAYCLSDTNVLFPLPPPPLPPLAIAFCLGAAMQSQVPQTLALTPLSLSHLCTRYLQAQFKSKLNAHNKKPRLC